MIDKPVSIRDVQRALGSSSNDLGTLCRNLNINKWAWFKPIRTSNIGLLNESIRQSARYGLFFRENTDAEDLLKGTVAINETNFNKAASSSYEWSYTRPTGGLSSPYRLTDFACEDASLGLIGYKHNTQPPYEIFGDWGVKLSTLNKVANTYSVVTTGSNYEWGILMYTDYTNTTEIYAGNIFTGYRMKYNTLPQYDINGPDPMAIPMTYLLSGAVGASENWRVGLIVFVPGQNGGSGSVGLFVSKKNIKDTSGVNGENVRDLSVEMCTNQELALLMYRYMSGKTEYTFRALPVLVKDVKISQSPKQFQTDIARTSINILSSPDTKIYPLPTGSVEIGIKIIPEDSGGDSEADATSNNFTLGIMWVGSTGYDPVNAITITYPSSITSEKTAQLDIDYVDADGTHTLNTNYPIPAGSYFMVEGVTYNGVIIVGGLRLGITTIRRFIVS
jgi:hypothetical protein